MRTNTVLAAIQIATLASLVALFTPRTSGKRARTRYAAV